VRRYQTDAVLDESQRVVSTPVLRERSNELADGRDLLGQDPVNLGGCLLGKHYFPYLFHRWIIASRKIACELPGKREAFPHHNQLVQGERLLLIAVEEKSSRLEVGQVALLRPAPADTPMTVLLVKGAWLSNAVPFHVARNRFPEQPEPIALLLWRPTRHFFEISCIDSDFGLQNGTLSTRRRPGFSDSLHSHKEIWATS